MPRWLRDGVESPSLVASLTPTRWSDSCTLLGNVSHVTCRITEDTDHVRRRGPRSRRCGRGPFPRQPLPVGVSPPTPVSAATATQDDREGKLRQRMLIQKHKIQKQ